MELTVEVVAFGFPVIYFLEFNFILIGALYVTLTASLSCQVLPYLNAGSLRSFYFSPFIFSSASPTVIRWEIRVIKYCVPGIIT